MSRSRYHLGFGAFRQCSSHVSHMISWYCKQITTWVRDTDVKTAFSVHTFEDDETPPGPYDEVESAGIREAIPIHEISKIFYADTGKILNMGTDDEVNSPVLLLKRALNAIPPRRMMERFEDESPPEQSVEAIEASPVHVDRGDDDSQSQIDAQFERDIRSSSVAPAPSPPRSPPPKTRAQWQIPSNLDPEWLAFEVYIESPDSSPESSPALSPVQSVEPE